MASERRSERVEQRKRKKIPLACEPCRERKSRCDGAKPICSTCQRRSLPLHHCIYTVENARTASNEAYIRVLHDRIRRLEKVCTDNGNPIPPLDPGDPGDSGDAPVPRNESTLLSPIPLGPRRSVSNLPTPHSSRSLREEETSPVLRPPLVVSPAHERLDATESAVSITAMGTVSTEHDACQAFDATNEFYGSSSAASFMKEACTSVKPHRCSDAHVPPPTIPAFSVNFARSDTLKQTSFAEAEKFALPPRNLADHLLSRFWERVYWLYPFFHKPTFLQAYERIWRPANQQSTEPSVPGLGLGSPGADSGSIVFHCALNTVFALGCQFSDLSPRDKASAIETFFNRSKAFVGLDFIDMHNVGVVQSLLLMALFLQSTPFPSRCWNSVGLAVRIAQGLGIHTESDRTSRPPLETEIRRRTWHGCVVLDMIVSMTYGRPTTVGHLPSLPLPSAAEFDGSLDPSAPKDVPSKMCFFVDFISQCRILGEILTSVYQPSCVSSASSCHSSRDDPRSHGLDAILELDAKLSRYETVLAPTMSWQTPRDISGLDEERGSVLVTQRTVLRGSFLYLRLMLHRPILTQLCANREPGANTRPSSPAPPTAPHCQELFTSFAAGCAKICLSAAMDLIELVHSTYLTNNTGGWWWDGLYAFTAGLAVIIGYLCPPLLASLDTQRLQRSWMLCQAVLSHFASFSISAHRSLRLLQKVHADVMSRVSEKDGEMGPARPPLAIAPGDGCVSGEARGFTQEAAAVVQQQQDETPLNLGSGFQWQFPGGVGSDIFGVVELFNWDQSLDFVDRGLGMDGYHL